MAVYTDINKDELEIFLSHYKIGSLLSYKGITEGIENSNFLLKTHTGLYILTLYEKRVKKEDLPFFLDLMCYLSNRGVSCPRPVTRCDGTFIGNLANRKASIITFLKGVWIQKPCIKHCRKIGEVLANLHISGSRFPIKRLNSLSIYNLKKIWDICRHRADELVLGLSNEIDQELIFLKNVWPKNLPKGIIHGDLFPDNVFFVDEKISGIIDFYFACYDFFSYDLAICINSWCFEKDLSFNFKKSNVLISSYCKNRSLNKHELIFLPILSRGAAMRFFLTRLYDWFYISDNNLVVKKNPMEFLQKIRFFSKIRNLSELGFEI